MTTPVETELLEAGENSVNSSVGSELIANNDSDKIIQNKTVKLSPAHYFLFFILFWLLFACYHILSPYVNTIIFAIILATVFKPIHRKIRKRFGRRENLAAFLSCILLTMVVVLPLTLILISLIRQGTQSFHAISEWIAAGKFNQLMELPWIVKIIALVDQYLPGLDVKNFEIDQSLLKLSATISKWLLNQGGSLVGNITAIFAKFGMMIFVFFFLIRDSREFVKSLLHLSPLSASQEDQIIEKVKSVASSALLGTFVTAIAQGTAGAIAFWIAGLPGLFWGIMMAFASLVPIVGTMLIWGPAALYLLLSGKWGYALFIVLWCAIVVGTIDQVVRPLFMKGSADMSTMLIFFAILGGINYFGLIGLLYGPLIFGLTMVLLYIYRLEFQPFLEYQDRH
ncbi:AI-2E family transporter [Desulfococcaceae bacterium HSG7]|nr:AI-2E family transporter [Desulfococcaceae bacterium HSG9]MDM8553264.1 AI-2E family transporter [Desulfococcaceae bacterium HSG7]